MRTALVTGASRGIGLQIARRLAADGFSLTVSARHEEGLRNAASELETSGASVVAKVADLAVEADLERLVETHDRHFGKADLVILNGGVGTSGTVDGTTRKTYDLTMNVNLRAQFLLARLALPLLRRAAADAPSRGAKLIAISSITGAFSEPGMAAYAASKAGLISLCESVTIEEAVNRVTATALCPGYVDTDMTSWIRDELDRESMITSDDVAELVLAVSRLSARSVVPKMILTRTGYPLWRP